MAGNCTSAIGQPSEAIVAMKTKTNRPMNERMTSRALLSRDASSFRACSSRPRAR